MDGDRPSRRAHILSSINPLREPGQTISSHKQDPPPSQHRAARADEADDDDDDDDDDVDDYAPAAPGKRHSKDERQQDSPQPSDRGAADGAYSSSRPTKFRFKSEKRSRNRRYSMDDPLLLGLKSRSRRRSPPRDGAGEGEGDDAEGRSGRREQDEDQHSHPSQSHRHGGDEHHSSHHHRRSRRHGDDDDDHDESRSSKRRRREHGDKTKTKKKKKKKTEEHEQEPEPEDPFAPPPLDADAAFRESLFDAMADDEGAAYWEGVYGQPIHTYGPPGDARGELEQMTSDEYADYVRRKMWEKTNPGLAEARGRRERERRARAREADNNDEDEDEDDDLLEARRRRRRREKRLAEEMDRSLRRGQERKRLLAWTARWRRYVDAWAAGGLGSGGGEASPAAGDVWPVESGKRADIAEAAVREFFARCADVDVGEDGGEDGAKAADPRSRLKDERVRWHPDKVQQRLGGKVDEALMRDVTTVFQIVDKLWAETRAASRT